jgi:PPP family 3-phenylpropionic acid transporter
VDRKSRNLLHWISVRPPSATTKAAWTNYFLLFAGYAVLSPYLQIYLKERGFPPSSIGVLLGCFELAGIAGPIILGRIADRRKTYRALLAAGFLVPAALFLPLEIGPHLALFLSCMLLMGFMYRSTVPMLDTIVSRALHDPDRQYGPLRVAGSFGFIAASLVLQAAGPLLLGSSRGIAVAFALSAAAAALATAFLPRISPDDPRTLKWKEMRQRHGGPVSLGGFDASFWLVIAIIFLGRFGIGAYYSFFSLYLQATFPAAGVSLIWAIGPLAEILTIYFSGRLIAALGLRMLLVLSLLAISARLSFFVFSHSIALVALSQLLHAFTFGTFHTAAIAYVNARIEPGKRATGMALYNAVGIGLPTFLASVIGGYVLEARGFPVLFISYAVVPLVGIFALLRFGKRLFPVAR